MKRFFFIMVMVFIVGAVCAIQPVRKPFIQIKIDGKVIKNGDFMTVSPGQKLTIVIEMEGGRRDFCKFPDTYADITSSAQILSRGPNGLTYQSDGSNAEWKLITEDISFFPDEYVRVNSQLNQSSAEISISNDKFSQSFLKIIFKSTWQFSLDGKTSQEENMAEGMVYFKVAGASDVWFSSQNIEARGMKNDRVQEQLKVVQSACDSIAKNFYRLNFTTIQQSIRNLQNEVNNLHSILEEVEAANPSYQTKILFIGLPSDRPYSNIKIFETVLSSWVSLEALVNDLKLQAEKLPEQPGPESKEELVKMIGQYLDWQLKIPESAVQHLPVYLPDLMMNDRLLPENVRSVAEKKSVSDYSQTLSNFNAFLDLRIEQVPNEIQMINSIHTRLQAIRLFDGMLQGYFSSISWADWKNARK